MLMEESDYDDSEDEGLSAGQTRKHENMIKGRIAETLIEELFLSLGYSVFRYGMENTVPEVRKLLRGVRGDVALNIRRMPDFVIQDKDRNVFFIEVKFRKNEKFTRFEKSLKDYPYKNCFFIIVSKRHIKCISYDELQKGEEISPESHKFYLGDRKEFSTNKEVIKDFCSFAVKFFENVE
jgi:hypothetical protein